MYIYSTHGANTHAIRIYIIIFFMETAPDLLPLLYFINNYLVFIKTVQIKRLRSI